MDTFTRRTPRIGDSRPGTAYAIVVVVDVSPERAEEVAMGRRIRIVVDELDCRPRMDPYRHNYQTHAEFRFNPRRRVCAVTQESGSPGVAVPEELWHGRVLVYAIGNPEEESRYPVERTTRAYLRGRDGQALLRRVCDGYESEWDGNNHVGALDDDARQAWDVLCAALDERTEEAHYCDAGDWIQHAGDTEVTADTTDGRLQALAEQYEREAWDEVRTVVGGVVDRLTEIRNDLREDD
jgi:hypothetical protein